MWLKVTVQEAAFDLQQEERLLLAEAGDAGALVAFQGMVRAHDQEHPLAALHLEHYPGMTEGEIERIAQQAAERWPVSACRWRRPKRWIPGRSSCDCSGSASRPRRRRRRRR